MLGFILAPGYLGVLAIIAIWPALGNNASCIKFLVNSRFPITSLRKIMALFYIIKITSDSLDIIFKIALGCTHTYT